MGLGVGIGAVGLAAAAAFAIWMQSKTPDMPTTPTVAAVETSAPADQPAAEAAVEAAPEAKPQEGVIDINQLADATASAAPVAGPLGGPLPPAGAPATSAIAKADPAKPTGPGEELGDAIRNRAGGGTDAPEEAEPAAEQSRKNVPDVPPTGAVTSAINAVKGNAKGCVAGADAPSSATITFGSSGAVQGVNVGGWAQGKSAAACIKSALSGARVPPFGKPTYATSVTIRP